MDGAPSYASCPAAAISKIEVQGLPVGLPTGTPTIRAVGLRPADANGYLQYIFTTGTPTQLNQYKCAPRARRQPAAAALPPCFAFLLSTQLPAQEARLRAGRREDSWPPGLPCPRQARRLQLGNHVHPGALATPRMRRTGMGYRFRARAFNFKGFGPFSPFEPPVFPNPIK